MVTNCGPFWMFIRVHCITEVTTPSRIEGTRSGMEEARQYQQDIVYKTLGIMHGGRLNDQRFLPHSGLAQSRVTIPTEMSPSV
jgi:hypothetical protein